MVRERNTLPRRAAIVAALAVLALVAGLFLVWTSADSRATDSPRNTSMSSETVSTTTKTTVYAQSSDGSEASARNSRDESGSVGAALAYSAASQRWLYLTDEQIKAAIAEIATPNATPLMAEDVASEISMVRDQLAQSKGPIWWIVRPLAWKVEQFNGSDARISVWTITILSAAGVAAPQSEFLTVILDLKWVENHWRVDAVRDNPGPTPITGPKDQPWDAEPFDEALDGFTRIGEESIS